MGVDIHCFVEKYNKDSGKWEELVLYKDNKTKEYVSKVPVRVFEGCRNSELFGLLGGVSSFEIGHLFDGCLVPNRGLPDNLSSEVKSAYADGEYFFNETWYDYCELNAYAYSLKISRDMIMDVIKNSDVDYNLDVIDALYDFMRDVNYIIDAYDIYSVRPNEIRIIMWFDH